MGQSATCTYREGRWLDGQHRREPYLMVSVHDSSVAIVEFGPARDEHDWLCLGHQPRAYFGDPRMPVMDGGKVVPGFVAWAREVTGREVDPAAVKALLPRRWHRPGDVFVEETLQRLLDLVGFPMPPQLGG